MPKKIVLAYSGGLDTSVILKWLQQKYQCPVVTFTADLGQGEELSPVRGKAESLGVKEVFIEDLREDFVKNYVFPMFRANAIYEGTYFLGTAIARPLIAKRQIEIAREVGADAVAHGATGKGNDQVRFELGYYANNSKIKVISPWREWELNSRNQLIDFAEKHQIPIAKDKRGESPFSTDANLLHTSSEGKVLEDPWEEAPEYVYSRTKSIKDAKEVPDEIVISFDKGDAVAINKKKLKPHELLSRLNDYGYEHGIGREDIVENRFVGMKSRGIYETPGGTILAKAHRAIESITLDRGEAHIKDEIMPKYAETIYNGLWFSSEREAMQELIDSTQKKVTGDVRIKLIKGNAIVVGRRSQYSKYNLSLVSFDEAGDYDQKDAEGFIKITSLRLKK
jgi:argininosuccinate synthase